MAYRSSTRGSARGSSRGGSSRTAPSTNMAAYAFAVVALVAVVIVLVVAMGGKDEAVKPADAVPVSVPTAPPAAVGPAVKPVAPFPKVDDALITKAKNLAKTFDAPAADAKRLYDEAMKAKQAGNDTLWQEKLGEAMRPLMDIRDAWNEVVAEMPSSKDYDSEEVANHYLGSEGKHVTDSLKLLESIRKTMRLGK